MRSISAYVIDIRSFPRKKQSEIYERLDVVLSCMIHAQQTKVSKKIHVCFLHDKDKATERCVTQNQAAFFNFSFQKNNGKSGQIELSDFIGRYFRNIYDAHDICFTTLAHDAELSSTLLASKETQQLLPSEIMVISDCNTLLIQARNLSYATIDAHRDSKELCALEKRYGFLPAVHFTTEAIKI